jgi:hypothetical protein
MKHLSIKFKQATLLLLGTIILPFAIQAQNDDDAEGNGGGAGGGSAAPAPAVTISVDVASQSDARITLVRQGVDFSLVITLSFSAAAEMFSESAALLNDIFTDRTISGGSLSSSGIFNRANMVSNDFTVKMIELGANYSGNQSISSAITSAVNSGTLSADDGYVGKLSAVLSNSSNYARAFRSSR